MEPELQALLDARLVEQRQAWNDKQLAKRNTRTAFATARRYGLEARHQQKLARKQAPMPDTLAAALAAFQAALPQLSKTSEAKVVTQKGNFSYRYADLATISAIILPALARYGLSWVTMPQLTDNRFVLHYQLLHTSGEKLEGSYPLPDARSPQELGSALTYARRYCLCAVTGVAAQEDDDDAAAAQKTAQSIKRRNQPIQHDRPDRAVGSSGGLTPQMRRMMALLGEAGHINRTDALAYCSAVTGRPIETRNDLTTDEVDLITRTLEEAAQEVHQQ